MPPQSIALCSIIQANGGQIGMRGTFYLTKCILLCFAGVHLVFPDFEEKERQVALNKLPIVREYMIYLF